MNNQVLGAFAVKRLLSVITAIVMLCMLSVACADGFSNDPDTINEAAKSVIMLEVYKDGDLIKTGSGFVAFDNRHLVTNYHVVDGADMIYAYSDVGDPYIIMSACITDSNRDIAILQFFSPTDLVPLTLNETGEVQRASSIVAIGSPKGLNNTVSMGNVSALYEENGISYIQFTAPISSGSSGGALFDDDGKVIGITTFTYVDGQSVVQNLNFAVNIQEVISLYELWDGKTVDLRDLEKSDIFTPEPTDTPKPTNTPKPTKTPAPPTEEPKIEDYQSISAGKLYDNRDLYTGYIVDLMTSMKVVQYSVEGKDFIVIGYGNDVYIQFIIRDYKNNKDGNKMKQAIKKVSSFTAVGKVIGGALFDDPKYKNRNYTLYIPVIEVESIKYKTK